jgi:hypothetical protein
MRKSLNFKLGCLVVFLALMSAVGVNDIAAQGQKKLYFVPLGPLNSINLDELISYYSDKYNITVEALAPVPLQDSAFDPDRQQYMANQLTALFLTQHFQVAENPNNILIGITEADMYIPDKPWQFAFAYNAKQEFSVAVVSNARMYVPSIAELMGIVQEYQDQTPDPSLRQLYLQEVQSFVSPNAQSRFKKMLTKQIGLLYFNYPQSTDPKSVMYNSILGVDELDEMGEDY